MSNWLKTLDGRLVNLRNIHVIYQDESTVEICYFDGERDGEKFKNEPTAISVFAEIERQLSLGYNLISIPEIVAGIEEKAKQADRMNGGKE